ncbi:MAG: tetratricopeptide repeat protein [Bacteroidia bacterium]|nr:tetratricopeptide repeat protein [Bacteroidia bacterium]
MLIELSENCETKDISNYCEPAITIADKLLRDNSFENLRPTLLNNKASAYTNLGFMHDKQGNVNIAKEYYEKALLLQEETGDRLAIAASLRSIGFVYKNRGEIPNALENFGRSLKISEKIGDKSGMALTLNNIGGIYVHQGDGKQALENFKRALKLNTELNDKKGIAVSLNNLGVICVTINDLQNALKYYEQSLKIQEEIGYKVGVTRAIFNIGRVYQEKGDYIKALENYKRSLEMYKEIGDKFGIAAQFHQLGSLYIVQAKNEKNASALQKNYKLALLYSDSSLVISKELGFPEQIRNAEANLSAIYSKTGKYELAFEHYKKYIVYRDSLNNDETRKASVKSQLKYEYEKKEAVIKEQQEKERAVAEEKNRFQKIVIISVVIGFVFVIIFAAFILRTLRTTRSQKATIERKQKEILESIQYAKRIQSALMPTESYVAKSLTRLKRNK